MDRGKNKRKSGSNECMDTNVMQEHYKPHLEPILSLDHEDPRYFLFMECVLRCNGI